jgi:hypothetical protein
VQLFPATNSGKTEPACKCLWKWTDDHRPIWAYIIQLIQLLTMATKCKKSCRRAFTSLGGFIDSLVPSGPGLVLCDQLEWVQQVQVGKLCYVWAIIPTKLLILLNYSAP